MSHQEGAVGEGMADTVTDIQGWALNEGSLS